MESRLYTIVFKHMANNIKIDVKKNKLTSSINLINAFRVMANVNRFRIFTALLKKEELTLSDIRAILKISSSSVVFHVKKLELNGFLKSRQLNGDSFYSINTNNSQVKLFKKFLVS